jgi:hypothetical protein
MSIVRVGSTKKYAEGWDQIFGKKAAAKKSQATPKSKKKPAARKK